MEGEMIPRDIYDESYYERRRRAYLRDAVRRFAIEVLEYCSKLLRTNLLKGHGRRALDVGCAHGYVVELLRELGYEAYGIEVSRIVERAGNRDALMLSSWTHLSFRSEIFDLVTSFDVIEHLPDHKSAFMALREAFRVLRGGGILILMTPRKCLVNILSDRLHGEHHYIIEDLDFWLKVMSRFTSRFTIITFSHVPMTRFPIFSRFYWKPLPKIVSRYMMIVAVKQLTH